MTAWIEQHPLVERTSEVVERLGEERPLIVATGPLTGDALATDLERRFGVHGLSYYDAIAPVVDAESIDWAKVFRGSRWSKGESLEAQNAYVNCPLDEPQ